MNLILRRMTSENVLIWTRCVSVGIYQRDGREKKTALTLCEHFPALNNGQHFCDQRCPPFGGFAIRAFWHRRIKPDIMKYPLKTTGTENAEACELYKLLARAQHLYYAQFSTVAHSVLPSVRRFVSPLLRTSKQSYEQIQLFTLRHPFRAPPSIPYFLIRPVVGASL